MIFRCPLLRPPSSGILSYSAFNKPRANLIMPSGRRSILINGNLKNSTVRPICLGSANGYPNTIFLQPRMGSDIPQQTSRSLAGSRSTRKRLSTNQYSDQNYHTKSCARDLLSCIFSRPTSASNQPYCYHQLYHSKAFFRPSIAASIDPSSSFPPHHNKGYDHEETIVKVLKLRRGAHSFQQSRTFSSNSVNLSQPYFAMKNSQGDTLRINLEKSRNFVGIRSTRCQREYNQDRYKVVVLNPPTLSPDIVATFKNGKSGSHNTEGAQMDAESKSLFYFAIFDGHGGSNTSDFLTAHLDSYIDESKPVMVPAVIKELRKLGGYFRTFRPQLLEPFLPSDFEEKFGVKKLMHQAKIHIKGKGGRARTMIFIPHPNSTEEEQNEEIKYLEGHQGEDAKSSKLDLDPLDPLEKKGEKAQEKEKVEEFEDDEDEDPFLLAKRRYMNRTSPLPGGTVAYSGANRSEYDQLVIRDPRFYHRDNGDEEKHPVPTPVDMTLEQRLCLSFLKCDAELARDNYRDGSTASVVVVQSKGPFWETTTDLDLIIAHVGDTRILLCEAPNGESIQLTTDHHPDATVESERIRRMAAYISSDSFGENMFMGRVANTRSIGDVSLKPYGISAEPEIVRRTVKAKDAAFLVLVSDGITGVMSNQEIVDCVKLEKDPMSAAANVLNVAEQLGAEDNCTALVVRLPAWGTEMPDLSRELREYRYQSEAQHSRRRR